MKKFLEIFSLFLRFWKKNTEFLSLFLAPRKFSLSLKKYAFLTPKRCCKKVKTSKVLFQSKTKVI